MNKLKSNVKRRKNKKIKKRKRNHTSKISIKEMFAFEFTRNSTKEIKGQYEKIYNN